MNASDPRELALAGASPIPLLLPLPPFFASSSSHRPVSPVWAQAKRTGLLFLTLLSSPQFIKHRLRRKMLYPRRM